MKQVSKVIWQKAASPIATRLPFALGRQTMRSARGGRVQQSCGGTFIAPHRTVPIRVGTFPSTVPHPRGHLDSQGSLDPRTDRQTDRHSERRAEHTQRVISVVTGRIYSQRVDDAA